MTGVTYCPGLLYNEITDSVLNQSSKANIVLTKDAASYNYLSPNGFLVISYKLRPIFERTMQGHSCCISSCIPWSISLKHLLDNQCFTYHHGEHYITQWNLPSLLQFLSAKPPIWRTVIFSQQIERFTSLSVWFDHPSFEGLGVAEKSGLSLLKTWPLN